MGRTAYALAIAAGVFAEGIAIAMFIAWVYGSGAHG